MCVVPSVLLTIETTAQTSECPLCVSLTSYLSCVAVVSRWREPSSAGSLRYADCQREIQRQRKSTRHPQVPPDQRLHCVQVGHTAAFTL